MNRMRSFCFHMDSALFPYLGLRRLSAHSAAETSLAAKHLCLPVRACRVPRTEALGDLLALDTRGLRNTL